MAERKRRHVEVFSAACPLCDDAVRLVERVARDSCDLDVLDMVTPVAQEKAAAYGITRIPTVVVDGYVADCCEQAPVNEAFLRVLGVGSPL